MCLKGGASCSENGRHKNSLPDSSSSRAAHGAVFDEPSEACADIDRSDEAIVGALRTRLGAVRRIAEVKRLQGLPVYDAVREASLLYKLRSMAGSDVEGVALPVYRTMMAAARRFEAQSQEAGEAVSGTVTLRLRSPADFTAVTEIFAVHDYVPESLSWVNPVIVLSATKPLPASMVRDLREHGIRIEAQDA